MPGCRYTENLSRFNLPPNDVAESYYNILLEELEKFEKQQTGQGQSGQDKVAKGKAKENQERFWRLDQVSKVEGYDGGNAFRWWSFRS